MRCTVLSITFQDEIAEKTQRLLEQNSFSVIMASDFRKLEELCTLGEFDIALVESEIQPKVKKAIGRLLQLNCPQVPVVEMCEGRPEIAGAHALSSSHIDEIVPLIHRTLNSPNLKSA